LSIPNPTLDDTSFQQLVDDAKKKIQAYSSVWTDYNESDPGITFIELFAWLADMQIYSLNRITDKSYLRFLKLLGVTLRPLIPSRVDISLNTDLNAPAFLIKKGTKFRADMPSEYYTDIIYETSDDGLCVTPFSIERILSHSNFQATEIKEASKIDGAYFYAFGEIPHVGNAFYLGLDGLNPDNTQKCFCFSSIASSESESKRRSKILISIYLYEKDLPPVAEHGSEEKPNIYLSTKVRWEYSTRDKHGNLCWWEIEKSKHHLQDTTKELTQSGKISFDVPFRRGDERNIVISSLAGKNKISGDTDNNGHNNLFWIRCVLIEGNYEISPRIDAILPNTVSAVYGTTVEEPLINISDNGSVGGGTKSTGFPNQTFSVGGLSTPNIPIIELLCLYTLYTVNGQDISCTKWEAVNDFDSSKPGDYHYVVNMSEGKIMFGNGVKGRIPDKGDAIILRYRYGDAATALIKPQTVFSIAADGDDENHLQALSGINPLASSPGTDQESIDQALQRARNELNIPFKAVSSCDYEYIALHTPGLRVARAKAFPSSVPGSNIVKMAVVPFSLSPKIPACSNGFVRTVAEHLNKHRLITTKVIVVGPKYIGISVTVSVTIKPGIDVRKIKGRISKALDDFLAPISYETADDSCGNTQYVGWPFGKAVYKTEVYAQIDGVRGVDRISNLSLSVSSGNHKTHDTAGNINIEETDLVYLDKCSITIE
jgi:predicted phage baseplate assembly protein